jgi:predicted nucleotidyltransferase
MPTVSTEVLTDVVRRLVAEFDPDQVILFGSHAWGSPHEDSDIDLLVIIPDTDERPISRAVRAHRCLRGILVPKDVLVKTRTEVDRVRALPTSLEAEILERGKVLYGRSEMRTRTELAPEGVA